MSPLGKWRNASAAPVERHFRMKGHPQSETVVRSERRVCRPFRAARKLLYWWASAVVGLAAVSRSRLNMLLSFIPSFGACLCHGGVAGAIRMDRRLWRSS
jgi:hypothetical protein